MTTPVTFALKVTQDNGMAEPKTGWISIRVRPGERELIQAVARERGMTTGTLIRQSLQQQGVGLDTLATRTPRREADPQ